MADESKIAWTDHTFNPWMGCQHVTHECDHCYADTLTSGRMGLDVFGGLSKRKRTSPALWARPAKWNRDSERDHELADALGRIHRVFCASLADLFEDAPGPNEWRDDVWAVIRATPWLDWQLLTKRPELVAGMLPDDWGDGWPNVWLGTSVGYRETADRARVLAAVPAFRRFISYEPALGPIFYETAVPDIEILRAQPKGAPTFRAPPNNAWLDGARDLPELDLEGIDWLICGGESGPGHRELDLAWAHEARWRCEEAGVAFFFKQDSGPRPGNHVDALGEVHHNFPPSWDRVGVAEHPAFNEQAGSQSALPIERIDP